MDTYNGRDAQSHSAGPTWPTCCIGLRCSSDLPLGISGTFIVSRHRLWDERFNCLRLRLYPCRQSRVLEGQARCILHDEGVWRLQAIRYVISSAVLGFGGIFRRTNPESRRARVESISIPLAYLPCGRSGSLGHIFPDPRRRRYCRAQAGSSSVASSCSRGMF